MELRKREGTTIPEKLFLKHYHRKGHRDEEAASSGKSEVESHPNETLRRALQLARAVFAVDGVGVRTLPRADALQRDSEYAQEDEADQCRVEGATGGRLGLVDDLVQSHVPTADRRACLGRTRVTTHPLPPVWVRLCNRALLYTDFGDSSHPARRFIRGTG